MKVLAILLLAFVLAPFAHSQTTTYTINATPTAPFHCSYTPSAPYCYGLPVTDNATGQQGQIFLLNGNLSFMNGYEGLGQAVYTSNDGIGHITFVSDPAGAYTGSVDFTYVTYLCGRWHNLHCWAITGGTVTITK